MGDEYVLVHVLGHQLCHDLRDVLREMAGSGAGPGRGSEETGPLTRVALPAAHQAVGGAPRGAAPLPDAQRGPPPALFDAKAPVSAGAPAPPRWLAHLRGKDSRSAGHDRGSLHPPILCTLPGWMPSHPLPLSSSGSQDGGQGPAAPGPVASAALHSGLRLDAFPAPAGLCAHRSTPDVESTAEAVAAQVMP